MEPLRSRMNTISVNFFFMIKPPIIWRVFTYTHIIGGFDFHLVNYQWTYELHIFRENISHLQNHINNLLHQVKVVVLISEIQSCYIGTNNRCLLVIQPPPIQFDTQ